MEHDNRRTITDNLHKYDYLAKEDDRIEICEWINGDGYDISINDSKIISLTRGEIDAIDYLVKTLNYEN
jgi:hypothetical protein